MAVKWSQFDDALGSELTSDSRFVALKAAASGGNVKMTAGEYLDGLFTLASSNGTGISISAGVISLHSDYQIPKARTIATTSPLSGGGDLSANRTLSIADAAADGTTKGAAAFSSTYFSSSSGVISLHSNYRVPTSRSIATTSPLSGGGDLSNDRTLSIADAAADDTTKGAAAFNSTNFTASSGVVNTIQGISTSATPQFTRLGIGVAANSVNLLTFTQAAASTGSPVAMRLNAGAHTTLAASTEANDVHFNLARTVQFAAGTVALQRAFLIEAPTYAAVSASTFTEAYTAAITGAPVAGTNATLTAATALYIGTGHAAGRGVTIRGASSQTADYLRIEDSTAVPSASLTVDSNRNICMKASGVLNVRNGSGNIATLLSYNSGSETLGIFTNGGQKATVPATSIGQTSFFTGLTIQPGTGSGGTIPTLIFTASAHTSMTASTEFPDVNFNLARTTTWATGNITTQRAFRIQAPTYAFAGSSTITDACTVDISGAPIAGTNATLTRTTALRISTGVAAGTAILINTVSSQTASPISIRTSGGTEFIRLGIYSSESGADVVFAGSTGSTLEVRNSGAAVHTLSARNSSVTFNANASATGDFRVFGKTVSNLLFTDASADAIGIGTNSPSSFSFLTIAAGTSSKAPLILNNGTNLTSPQNGAVEYNGTNLLFTRASSVRETVMCANSVNSVSPTSPDRTITIVIDGTTYYVPAKTTND